MRTIALLLVAAAASFSICPAQNAGPVPDARWNLSVYAGPFSQVSTAFGGLTTTIPIVHLKGVGATSLDFSIQLRSNQEVSAPYGAIANSPGTGWQTNLNSEVGIFSVDGVNRVTQTWYGTVSAGWSYTVNGTSGIPIIQARMPGVRSDCTTLGSQVLTGYEIIDQTTKNAFYYQFPVFGSSTTFMLSSIVDPHGNTVTINRDSNNQGRPTTVVDAGNRTLTFNYYANGVNNQLGSVVLSAGGTTREWDFVEKVKTYLDHVQFPQPSAGVSASVAFDYSTDGNITDLFDLNGNHWHYAYTQPYSPLGGIIACTNVYHPLASTTTNQYDLSGTNLAWSFSSDNTERYCDISEPFGPATGPTYYTRRHAYYNGNAYTSTWVGNPIKRDQDSPVNGTTYQESYVWNVSDGTQTQRTDRRGYIWNYSYDSINHGDLFTLTDPLGQQWGHWYSNDRLIRTENPLGFFTDYAYDTANDLTEIVVDPVTDIYGVSTYNDPKGITLTTRLSYDSSGHLISKQTGSVTATTFGGYDNYGHASYMIDPHGIPTYWNYDAFGNKTAETLPSPRGTEFFSYDNWDRLIEQTHPGPSYRMYSYDNNGNRLSVTDENGNTVSTVFDTRNRPVDIIQPSDTNSFDNLVTFKTYDEANLMGTSWIGSASDNQNSGYTSYLYDVRGDLIKTVYPDSSTKQFVYDGNKNRTQRTDGRGNITKYTFDAINRLTNVGYPSGSVAYGYRGDNLRTSMVDATGTSTWNYNDGGQLTSSFQAWPNKTVAYGYDDSGRKHTMTVGAQTWTYNYDQDRLWTIDQTLGQSPSEDYEYYNDGSVYIRNDQNGSQSVFGYDTRGRCTYIDLQPQDSYSEDQVINTSYDAAGNVTAYSDEIVGDKTFGESFAYDNANRIISETPSDSRPARTYGYDGRGNRISRTLSGSTSTLSYDLNNKFMSGQGYSVASYDGDGNPASFSVGGSGTWNFVYDYEDRATSVTYPSGAVNSFRYNGDGQRVEKVDGTGTERYLYDGNDVIARVSPTGSFVEYILPGCGGIDENGQQIYTQNNTLGSTVAQLDPDGAVLSLDEYDAFGVATPIEGTYFQPWTWGGQRGYMTDGQSQLNLCGSRYYIPALGRWLTQDPKGHAAGLNLYEYCDDNPLAVWDPDGTDPYLDLVQAEGNLPFAKSYGAHDLARPLTMDNGWPISWAKQRPYAAGMPFPDSLLTQLNPQGFAYPAQSPLETQSNVEFLQSRLWDRLIEAPFAGHRQGTLPSYMAPVNGPPLTRLGIDDLMPRNLKRGAPTAFAPMVPR